jgi:hypothetical protein
LPKKLKHSSLKNFKVPFHKGIKIEALFSYDDIDKDKYWIFKTGGFHPLKGLLDVPEMYNKDIWPMIISVTKKTQFIKQVPNVGTAGIFYPRISLSRKQIGKDNISKSFHRMIAEAFLPNPNNLPVVNHINKNKLDYRIENLEWVTKEDNAEGSTPVDMDKLWKSIQKFDWWKINKHDESLESIKKKQTILIESNQLFLELTFKDETK